MIWDMDKGWPKTLDIIKNQVNAANFRTWFAQIRGQMREDGSLMISVPSAFIKQQLSVKYLPILESAVQEGFGRKLLISFKVEAMDPIKPAGDAGEPEEEFTFNAPLPPTSNVGLNPKYNLQNFVVGLSNNLAYAAAQAVIQNPGTSYNPLYIYGGTGVGKTHLMQGIGNALLTKNPYLKIIYCSSEKFMNDYIQSIQTKRTGDFRSRYRACDLLLIDDIQFISGKDSTQEEFFHTFNELQTKNAQVVLTSDLPPNEIQKLEPRLQSRFQGGLMVDMQLPDFDTRVAILKAKCQEKREDIPEESLRLIAENVAANTRELEGKLIQIIQTAKLSGRVLDEEYIRQLLGKPVPPPTQKLDHKKVISGINQYFNIRMVDITGPRRKKELVLPRQLAMYLLYEECKLPYERIGELLGGRDHTTIMHGVEKINEAAGRDREVQRMLIEIRQSLQGPS